MALVRIDHVPESVGVNLPLNVILPDPGKMGDVPVARRKVLYLLHGLSDDASAWQRYTSIETLAAAYGLVVVMPSAGRSFYTDQPNGQKYFTYLTEELPRYLADVFDLTPRREDTFIAGNSMGGYGAFKAALLHPELYAAAASFSGVLAIAVLALLPDTDPRKQEFALLFGDLENLAGGEHDPAVWLTRAAKDPSRLPRLFISCQPPGGYLSVERSCSTPPARPRACSRNTTRKTARTTGSSGTGRSGFSSPPFWVRVSEVRRKSHRKPAAHRILRRPRTGGHVPHPPVHHARRYRVALSRLSLRPPPRRRRRGRMGSSRGRRSTSSTWD